MLFPEFATMREACRLVSAQSCLLEHEGKYEAAIAVQSKGFRIAEQAATDPTVISLLVGIACETLTLSGYVRIKTEEPDPKETFDRAYIQLEWPDDRPDLLWLPVEWTVDQANSDWVQFSAVKTDTAQIAGQKVMLRARAETDPNLKSSFWVDSLSLVAKCGR